MKIKIILLSMCCLGLITGCINNYNKNKINNSAIEYNNNEERKENVTNLKVTINDKTYILNLDSNKTAQEFINLLPQQFTMSELNDNEKYVYMNNSLTTNPYNPKQIKKGDVMLYEDNCLVIFYKSFDTRYSYTKIGHIDNLDDLEEGSIKVKFEKN